MQPSLVPMYDYQIVPTTGPRKGHAFDLRRPSNLAALVAASASGVAILLAAGHVITLAYSMIVLAPLSAVLIVSLLVWAGRGHEEVLRNRILGGLIAGIGGLVVYDLIRLFVMVTGLVPFNPFRPIEVYGLLILDRYTDTPLTKTVGWGFHIWNGLSFAVMYTLAAGRGRVLWALGWAMILETAMLATYPTMFQIALNWPFVAMSLIGHVGYGIGIGITARRSVTC